GDVLEFGGLVFAAKEEQVVDLLIDFAHLAQALVFLPEHESKLFLGLGEVGNVKRVEGLVGVGEVAFEREFLEALVGVDLAFGEDGRAAAFDDDAGQADDVVFGLADRGLVFGGFGGGSLLFLAGGRRIVFRHGVAQGGGQVARNATAGSRFLR